MYIGTGGKKYILGNNPIGGGGEGSIYEIVGNPSFVAKIFSSGNNTKERENKLKCMIHNKPTVLEQYAWPIDLLYKNGTFYGYVMPKVSDKVNLKSILIYERREGLPWSLFLYIARNLASAVHNVHEIGQAIGDLNPDNIMVNERNGRIILVDTDSFVIRDGNMIYKCLVNKTEFAAAEILQGKVFNAYTDRFALAILIFKLLMNGTHPFAYRHKDIRTVSYVNTIEENVEQGICVYFSKTCQNMNIEPPPQAPDFNCLPKSIQTMFKRAFVDGCHKPDLRPTAEEWYNVLDKFVESGSLVTTCGEASHIYYKPYGQCPWCEVNAEMNGTRKKAALISQQNVQKNIYAPAPSPRPQYVPPALQPSQSPAYVNNVRVKPYDRMYKLLVFAVLATITMLIISHINKNNIIAPWMYTSTKNKVIELYENGNYDEAIVHAQKLDYSKDQELIYKCYQKIWNNNSISAGGSFIVGIIEDGTVVSAGENKYGQCNVSDWNNIIAVSAGTYHTVGLKTDGTVVAVGNNEDGQCQVYQWNNIVAISAGNNHTVGLKSDGTVVACGGNRHGQCDVSDWSEIIAVSAGDEKTMGLKADGTVEAIGINDYNEQSEIATWTDIVQVSAGGEDTVGLKSNGRVVAAGYNSTGSCNVDGWYDVISVDCVTQRTVGLKSDDTVLLVGGYYDSFFRPYRLTTDTFNYGDVISAIGYTDFVFTLKPNGTIGGSIVDYFSRNYVDDLEDDKKSYIASEWTNIKTGIDKQIETASATSKTTAIVTTTAATSMPAKTTSPELTTTAASTTAITTEPTKVNADYLFVTPDPERILLMSGNFNGKYVTGNGRYTTTKSGYYGFEITTEHPDSLPSLSIKDTYSSTKTKGYLSLDNQQEYEFVLFEKETGKIDFEDLTYGYKVMMYIPNDSFEIDGSFTANVFHNAQKQVYYFKPEVTGTYCFEIECSDSVNIEFDIREKHAEYAEKNIDINDYKKTDITLDAGTTYEITVYSRSKAQGSYTVLIS